MSNALKLAAVLFGAAPPVYATWNPSDKGSAWTLSNGNLTATSSASSMGVRATKGKSSGKWYWEVKASTVGSLSIGVANLTANVSAATPVSNNWVYYLNGHKFGNGNDAAYGASYITNDVIGIALDMDAGTITFYKNNTSQGTAFTGLSGTLYPVVWQNSDVSVALANFGATALTYSPPAGFNSGIYS